MLDAVIHPQRWQAKANVRHDVLSQSKESESRPDASAREEREEGEGSRRSFAPGASPMLAAVIHQLPAAANVRRDVLGQSSESESWQTQALESER